MPLTDIDERRAFLDREHRRRGDTSNVFIYYRDIVDQIDKQILPLVRALDSPLTTPVCSCEGHWAPGGRYSKEGWCTKTEPCVAFLPLPGKGRQFRRFLHHIMHHTPLNRTLYTLYERHHPRTLDGPFEEWWLHLDLCLPRRKTEAEFERAKRIAVRKYTTFFRKQLALFAD